MGAAPLAKAAPRLEILYGCLSFAGVFGLAFSVLHSRLLILFSEGAAEISRIRKAGLIGDRCDRLICACKQVGSALQSILNEIRDG